MRFFDKIWKEKNYRFYAERHKNSLWVHFQGQIWLWAGQKQKTTDQKADKKQKELILSPLPAKIQKVFVRENDRVKKGDSLILLSAMKIEYHFQAEGPGRVEKVFCHAGESVELGKELIKIKYDQPVGEKDN